MKEDRIQKLADRWAEELKTVEGIHSKTMRYMDFCNRHGLNKAEGGYVRYEILRRADEQQRKEAP